MLGSGTKISDDDKKIKSENLFLAEYFWQLFAKLIKLRKSWQFSVKKRATKLRLEGKFDSSNPRYRNVNSMNLYYSDFHPDFNFRFSQDLAFPSAAELNLLSEERAK